MNSSPPSHSQTNLWPGNFPSCDTSTTLGGLLFGYDTGVISGAIEPLTAKSAIADRLHERWASGCVIVGCAVGVLFVGPRSDRFGTRWPFTQPPSLFLASAIGTAIPNNIITFIIFRFIGGLGIGIASISTPMLDQRKSPPRISEAGWWR